MSEPSYSNSRQMNKRALIVVGVVATALILVVVLMSSGSDDPVADGLVPPVNTAASGPTGQTATPAFGQSQEYDGPPAADGAPLPGESETKSEGTAQHDDGQADKPPAKQATGAGQYVDTARRFAELSINRPTDAAMSVALDKKLVELSAGSLARDLDKGRGQVQTAQVASKGEVLRAIPLKKEGDYAEVLIVSRQRVIDQASGVALDPKYLTYLVRLEQVPGGKFAVTSWEPQI